ncbi:hypothetical protein [Vibrio splendidus]|uniref:hypothetical protein n=1 Tax=Vibrio splendidus TaxID=29497 RepID=UPI000C83EBFD|nr:hypothetical protein [Vibrio splendidus]PMH10116.1 hypothetical protein BCU75_10750 [Vibrio splendidus]
MNVINIRGGLGNQILQLSLMLNKEKKFIVNTNEYNLNKCLSEFDILTCNNYFLSKLGLAARFFKSTIYGVRSDLDLGFLVDGYFQANIDDDVIPDPFSSYLYNHLLTYREQQEKFDLVIHFRGGDYLDPVNAKIFENIRIEYYLNAISELCSQENISLQELKIAIITNDISLAKDIFSSYLPKDTEIMMNSELGDFSYLENARFAIIPNSTFSLTARLIAQKNDISKVTYYPSRWFTNSSKMIGPKIKSFHMVNVD